MSGGFHGDGGAGGGSTRPRHHAAVRSSGEKRALDRRTFLGRSGLFAAGAVLLPGAASRRPRGSSSLKGKQEIGHRSIQVNGIRMHLAEAGGGPLVLFLHGFPETWYSWRHQLPAVAAAGYHAVVPDLRGYGDTEAPDDVEAYRMRCMMDDVIGIMDHLGAERAVLVGHDWGANIAWAVAEHDPDRVAGVVALGVPYHERPPVPPTRQLERFAEDRFNFVLYFQTPGVAESELERDVRASLRRFFHALSGDAPADLLDALYRERGRDSDALDGMPDPAELPSWLDGKDLDVYARAFEESGFGGALSRYRNLDRDWHELPNLGAAGVTRPALFVAGTRDPAVVYGSLEPMLAAAPGLTRVLLLPGCGHWTQQERPEEVTAELIRFLRQEVGPPWTAEQHEHSQ